MVINNLSRRCADMTFTVPTSNAITFQLCVDVFGLDPDTLIADYVADVVFILSSVGGDIFAEDCS